MNAKIRRMSYRRAKKALKKLYINEVKESLRTLLFRDFSGQKINDVKISDIKTALMNMVSSGIQNGVLVQPDPDDKNRIIVNYPRALEKYDFNPEPTRVMVDSSDGCLREPVKYIEIPSSELDKIGSKE